MEQCALRALPQEGRMEEEGLAGDPKVDGRVDMHARCMQIRAAAYTLAASLPSGAKDVAAFRAAAVLPSAGKVGADAAAYRAAAVLPSAGKVGADAVSGMTAAVLASAGKVGADAAAYRAAVVLPSPRN